MLDFRGQNVFSGQVDVECPAAFGVFALGEKLCDKVCIEVAAVESHVRCCEVLDVHSGRLHGGFATVESFDLLKAWSKACRNV